MRNKNYIDRINQLEKENALLKSEAENLPIINDVKNQELADIRTECEKARQEFLDEAAALKELKENYTTLMTLCIKTKDHYEKAMQAFLKANFDK